MLFGLDHLYSNTSKFCDSLLLSPFLQILLALNQTTDRQTHPTAIFPQDFPAWELEISELLMLIWQYDLRNTFASSEKVCLGFLSYLMGGGKGPALRMAGCWSQEVLNVRWHCALREVGEAGGTEAAHQKHLRLHLKKGQYQQENFRQNSSLLLTAYKEFTCSVYTAVDWLWEWELIILWGCLERSTDTDTHGVHADSQVFLLKSCMAGYATAYYSSVTFIVSRHWRF